VLDMDAMWAESDSRTPMICFLSMGSDPTDNIERLAKSKGIRTYIHDITLFFFFSFSLSFLEKIEEAAIRRLHLTLSCTMVIASSNCMFLVSYVLLYILYSFFWCLFLIFPPNY